MSDDVDGIVVEDAAEQVARGAGIEGIPRPVAVHGGDDAAEIAIGEERVRAGDEADEPGAVAGVADLAGPGDQRLAGLEDELVLVNGNADPFVADRHKLRVAVDGDDGLDVGGEAVDREAVPRGSVGGVENYTALAAGGEVLDGGVIRQAIQPRGDAGGARRPDAGIG